METKKVIIFTSLTLFLSFFSGCTAKAWYNGGQYGAKQNCHNQPPSEIKQCLENLNKETFEEYEKNVKLKNTHN